MMPRIRFPRMPDRRVLGARGERAAESFLTRRGYRIVERNYRTARGELDLVAYHGDVLVIVEVKARSTDRFGGAREAVDRRKRMRLTRLALGYLQRRARRPLTCRFDVVTIDMTGSGPEGGTIELIQNAFDAELEGI